MIEDVLTVQEVAQKLKKSVSWCYDHAAALGAARIGGSLIFSRSTLKTALENALMKPKKIGAAGEGSGNVVSMKKKKTPPKASYSNTDPSKYGLADFTLSALANEETVINPEDDPFSGIDLLSALKSLRRS